MNSPRPLRFYTFLILLVAALSCRTAEPKAAENRLGAVADAGMVVTARPEASLIAARVLGQGGSAIDAAVAAHFALAVCYPIAGNLGGGGFLVFRREDGIALVLDFRETAPLAAHANMFLDESGGVIPDASTLGHRAAGVPGSVAGLYKAHQRYGILPWADLIQPAIDLADTGFILRGRQVEELNDEQENFARYNPGNTYLRQAGGWREGDRLLQKDLAETLRRIRDRGAAGFYHGETARAIAREMERGGGLIDTGDLAAYEAIWRTPIIARYDSFTVICPPPPSSGGVALAQLLGMLEPYPLREWGRNSSRTVHYLAEAERRVYADRAVHLGDPEHWPVPVEQLLDPEYLRQRMEDVQPGQATSSRAVQAGVFEGTHQAPVHAKKESEQTTHFSIVDRGGNAVSLTTTLNDAFGSRVFVDGAGFLLNNEMDDFSVKPNTPNLYGLIGGEANAIAPGKRMLSSMTPVIVEKQGRLYAVIGSPGGSTIITSVLQTFLNLVEFDHTMQEAVSAPRFHHQWVPDSIRMEAGALADTTMAQLVRMGYVLYNKGPIGRVDAIRVLPDGRFEGGADPRGDDRAAGVHFVKE